MSGEHDAADARDFWKYSGAIRRAQYDFNDGSISLTALSHTVADCVEELEVLADVTESAAVRRRCYEFLRVSGLEAADATA